MSSLQSGGDHLGRELTREPVAASAAGSLLLHAGIVGALALYGVIGGFLHHNFWGSPNAGGSIQVSLVSNALPLPAEKVNDNVLATEKPSEAPAPPAPKAKQAVDQSAIPISGKQVAKPQPQSAQKVQPHQQAQNNYRAQYGEQSGSSMPRATSNQTGSIGPASINQGDFGSRFGWYVDAINRKMATSWYKAEVTPSTPRGARVFLTFTISRSGNPSDVQVDRSSGSPSLDRSCQRGVQRVDSFGPLPAAYNQSTLKVSYYCEY